MTATSQSYGAVLGEALDARQAGRFAEAQAGFERAIDMDPRQAPAHFHLACLLHMTGRLDQAAISYRTAATLAPDVAMIHVNFGVCRQALGRLDEALDSLERAVALTPMSEDAHANLGLVLQSLGRLKEAEASMRRALALQPNAAMFHSNLGTLLRDQGRLDESIAAFERALAISPDSVPALVNLHLARFAKAEADAGALLSAYRRALLVTPGFAVGQDKLLMTLNYLPDLSAADLAEAHREFGRTHARLIAAPPAPHINTREPERRLRVGYMSPDFRHHSCAFFAAPLLRAHDRDRVEVFAYAEIGAPDAMTAKIKADVDHWRETTRKSDDDVAATVRADRIDILVDLAGHTTGNRLGVFLRKPAPVQATWLGYPATTGVAAIDYRLTDAIADPEGADAFATEQLVRLPSGFLCYEPPADMPAVTPLPARKRGHVTFGCFNNALKINAATVARWAEIMRAVPNARLLVKGFHTDGGLSRGRLNDLLTGQGIAPERFDLRAASPTPQEHFAAYGEVDVALDTAPYNGTATTCEAMWSGVPTVALRGDRHAARVGASLMAAAGLPELVAESPAEYVAKAVGLAGDLERLATLRATLRERMRASPLTDAATFARAMEAAYRTMWRRWCGTGA